MLRRSVFSSNVDRMSRDRMRMYCGVVSSKHTRVLWCACSWTHVDTGAIWGHVNTQTHCLAQQQLYASDRINNMCQAILRYVNHLRFNLLPHNELTCVMWLFVCPTTSDCLRFQELWLDMLIEFVCAVVCLCVSSLRAY